MTLELSKFVVLRAKELLSMNPRSGVLTRDEFVAVCLSVARLFLRRRQRRGESPSRGGGGGGILSHATPSSTPRRIGGERNHSATDDGDVGSGGLSCFSESDDATLLQLVEQELEATRRRLAVADKGTLSSPPPLCYRNREAPVTVGDAGGWSESMDQLDVEDVVVAPSQQLVNNSSSANSNNNNNKPFAFTALHPIHVEVAQIVKARLDPLYHDSLLSKEEYTNTVIGVVEEAARHPQLAGMFDAARSATPPAGTSSASRGRMNNSRSITNNNTNSNVEELHNVVDEMTKSIANFFILRAAKAREEADQVAHEVRRSTRCGSTHHQHRRQLSHGTTTGGTDDEWSSSREASRSPHPRSISNVPLASVSTKSQPNQTTATVTATSATSTTGGGGGGGDGEEQAAAVGADIVAEDEAAFNMHVSRLREVLRRQQQSPSVNNQAATSSSSSTPPPGSVTDTESKRKELAAELQSIKEEMSYLEKRRVAIVAQLNTLV